MVSNEQKELALGFREIRPLIATQGHLVASCNDFIDSVNLCMNQSIVKRTRETWAELLGMSQGTLSLILNKGGSEKRRRNFPPELINVVQRLSGNTAINQWLDMELKGELNSQQSSESRKEKLLAELAEIEKQQAG